MNRAWLQKSEHQQQQAFLRRAFILTCVITLGLLPKTFAQTRQATSFDTIIEQAQERATKPFAPAQTDLPAELQNLTYDTYREIRFQRDKALWASEDLPFRLEFFHPGYLYRTPVNLHEFTPTHAQRIRFVKEFFDYGKLGFDKKLPPETGYAGFRLLHPVNQAGRWDEIASFLGSSYFRMLGKGQRYGTSARGLAINSGETDLAEEFPVFTDWWIGKPEKDLNTIRLFAILDSPGFTGAYDFLVRPGESTVADVSVVLFRRGDDLLPPNTPTLKTVGLAPLTSMFWFGENSAQKPDDYRAEVHDCDGLLIRDAEDQFTWRPITNPRQIQHHAFPLKNPKGFGLLQRDRAFESYQDLFNLYHQTPSVWIEPRGEWGEGEIRLVELPTRYEGDDNVVAFWNPKEKPMPRQPFRYGYTLHWSLQPDANFPVARVLQTRLGADPSDPNKRQFIIDFADPAEPLSGKPEAEVIVPENAVLSDTQVVRNEMMNSWRVIFSVLPKGENSELVELSCALDSAGRTISETWRYRCDPHSTNLAQN